MDKKRILEILEGAKDDKGEIPMSLVRKAFEKIEEPCTDAVSRQEAIRIAEQGQIQGFEWQIKKLLGMPSAQPKQQWIPCSERLPEVDKEVFVYLFKDSPYIAWLDDCGIWFTEDFYVDEDEQPVAWMPLPEPYKDTQ